MNGFRAQGALVGLVLLTAGLAPVPVQADCIDDAARAHGVNRHVLRAIGWHESRLRSGAMNRNANGSVDVGAFQMNSVHFPRLAAQGVGPAALRDGCTAARVAAAHYRRLVERHGPTWRAVGAYHSEATPARQHWYAQQIAQVLVGWGLLPPGTRPFDGRPLLRPGEPRSARTPGAAPLGRPGPATTGSGTGTLGLSAVPSGRAAAPDQPLRASARAASATSAGPR